MAAPPIQDPVDAAQRRQISISIAVSAEEFQQQWAADMARIEQEFANLDAGDTIVQEAASWNQFKYLLLKDYRRRVFALQARIERLRLTMRSNNRAIEARFKAAVASWATYLEQRLSGAVLLAIRSRVQTEVTKHVSTQLEDIVSRVVALLDAHHDENITQAVDDIKVRLTERIRDELRDTLVERITQKFDSFDDDLRLDIEAKVRGRFEGSLDVLVTNTLKEMQTHYLEATLSGVLQDLYSQVNRLKQRIQVSITTGDRRLHAWAVDEVLSVKTCLSARDVLSGEFEALARSLQADLDSSACAQERAVGAPDLLEPVLPNYILVGEQ